MESPSHLSGAPPSARERALQAEVDGLKISLARTRRASHRLAVEAATDPLTGLANRRTFYDLLNAEVERAHRYGRALSVAVLDVDDFKSVNDAFGHGTGDSLLAHVAAGLLNAARATDHVARLGGDEFAVVLPETTGTAANLVAERAHELMRVGGAYRGPAFTVSIGISDLVHASTTAQILRNADAALYWAKSHGSDGISRYSPSAIGHRSDDERTAELARNLAFGGLRTLARIVDGNGSGSDLHSDRVARMASRLAAAMDWPAERIFALRETALIHDVGKLAIPVAVLLNPGALCDEERDLVRTHAALGAQMANSVLSDEQCGWLRGHHERFDGSGYPEGLAGLSIPDGARLLAVADSWDVMTSERPYAPAMTAAVALQECARCVGSQFFAEPVEILAGPAFAGTLLNP